MIDPYLDLFTSKKAVVAAPAGQMQPPSPPPGAAPPGGPQGAPPMDPSMMGGGMPPPGAPPMDPSMMGGGMPPMDPSMMGGAPPMDPSMMGGGMPPSPSPADLQTEISDIKAMLQQLMDAQVAMMQAFAPPGAMPPPGPQGMPPMDSSMMGGGMPPPGMNGGMDPSMMGLPPAPPPGMIAQASYDEQEDFANYIRSITELLR